MVADIDRMGAMATDTSRRDRPPRQSTDVLPAEVNGDSPKWERVAVELGNSAQEVMIVPRPGEGRAHPRRRRRDGRPPPPHVYRVDGPGVRHGVARGRRCDVLGRFARGLPTTPSRWRAESSSRRPVACPMTRPSPSPVAKAARDVNLRWLIGRVEKISRCRGLH